MDDEIREDLFNKLTGIENMLLIMQATTAICLGLIISILWVVW